MSILVTIIMGSQSDWSTMEHAGATLELVNIPYEARVLSAHRTPDALFEYVASLPQKGAKVIIAGAGGAAHLPGVIAAKTLLPVIGVPIQTPTLNGMDSLLSIVQMPGGIPVATMAIGKAGAINAGLFAAHILSLSSPECHRAIKEYRENQAIKILENSDLKRA